MMTETGNIFVTAPFDPRLEMKNPAWTKKAEAKLKQFSSLFERTYTRGGFESVCKVTRIEVVVYHTTPAVISYNADLLVTTNGFAATWGVSALNSFPPADPDAAMFFTEVRLALQVIALWAYEEVSREAQC